MLDLDVIQKVTRREERLNALSRDQVEVLARLAVSGRRVDLLIGPAGAGKTTAMRVLHRAWTDQHGHGTVVGLAPSAAAAQVLAEDLGIQCENTAKWLHEHDAGRARFCAGQLVILDEATLAGTLTVDRLTSLVADAGAKVLLVGDWAQLQSVEAGGAFTLLASVRADTPELTEVHRFTNEWEKAASLNLRFGRTEVIGRYLEHDRVRGGTTAEMIDAAYASWRADVSRGLDSVLITESTQSVTELNQRARAERLLDGDTVAGAEVNLVDGTSASEGDIVITRRNERRLQTGSGSWVCNGDRWIVQRVLTDGSICVRRLGHGGGEVDLPAAYVAERVDLGYAVTAHRAQGITIDTSHVVVTSTTTRENLYVSMTRGRRSNIAYVALDKPDDSHSTPEPNGITASTVLFGVLKHSGAELSAHQTIEAEQARWSSIAQLGAEYETIAAVAQQERWTGLLRNSGLTEDQMERILDSDSFGPLTAELRRAEAGRHDLTRLMSDLIIRRSLEDADDVGAVLISRLHHVTASAKRDSRRVEPKLIAGLIPLAVGPMGEEMATALQERQELIESRAMVLAAAAVEKDEPWLSQMGGRPMDANERKAWLRAVQTVAAYRDRYNVDADTALGGEAGTDAQKLDRARARQAVRRAQEVAANDLHDQPLRAPALGAALTMK
ncbi:AAA family ATPase [Nocardioides sp. Y6]|uniref:AAA family ATPase n=1 Tax=Nocardioides malaquae TaxID=2773426 RepID=A0ABR9RS96_9ACTN|nr:AAA family ATPase [Nocardioides malaquae]MBE7324260.1 AAA family ATPase [Nocardioides malaquae]